MHHKDDPCRGTPYRAALESHERYGTELISMEGGISVGNRCEPFSHHGFNGVERETMDAIKNWIRGAAAAGSSRPLRTTSGAGCRDKTR